MTILVTNRGIQIKIEGQADQAVTKVQSSGLLKRLALGIFGVKFFQFKDSLGHSCYVRRKDLKATQLFPDEAIKNLEEGDPLTQLTQIVRNTETQLRKKQNREIVEGATERVQKAPGYGEKLVAQAKANTPQMQQTRSAVLLAELNQGNWKGVAMFFEDKEMPKFQLGEEFIGPNLEKWVLNLYDENPGDALKLATLLLTSAGTTTRDASYEAPLRIKNAIEMRSIQQKLAAKEFEEAIPLLEEAKRNGTIFNVDEEEYGAIVDQALRDAKAAGADDSDLKELARLLVHVTGAEYDDTSLDAFLEATFKEQ